MSYRISHRQSVDLNKLEQDVRKVFEAVKEQGAREGVWSLRVWRRNGGF